MSCTFMVCRLAVSNLETLEEKRAPRALGLLG